MGKAIRTGRQGWLRQAGRIGRTAGIILVLAVTIGSQMTQTSHALFGKQRLIYEDNVLYFDYKDSPILGACAGADTGGGSIPLSGRDNIEKAFRYFIARGLTAQQSAGIVGNLIAESGVNPEIKQTTGGPGRGIAQWEVGGRWDTVRGQGGKPGNVKDFAASPEGGGRQMTDLGLQLDFLWNELNHISPWKNALPKIKAATTFGEVSTIFLKDFERPRDQGEAVQRKRAELAGNVLREFGDTTGGGDAAPIATITDACGAAGGTTVNCTDGGGAAVSGRAAILCEARKFDPFGYLWGGGHGVPAEKWMADFMAAGGYSQPFKRILDCTGLMKMALYNVYKVNLEFNTRSMASVKEFREIPIADTQPGDFVWREGHAEIVAAPQAAETFGARTQFAPEPRQITGGGKQNWSKAYRYYGPGAEQ